MSENSESPGRRQLIEQIKRLPEPIRGNLLDKGLREDISDAEAAKWASELKAKLDGLPSLTEDIYRAARKALQKNKDAK